MVSIASVFIEEIERKFRNSLPPECVKILILMADQSMQLEQALNSQQRIIEKLMKFMVLSETHQQQIMKELAKHDKRFNEGMPITEHVEKPDDGVH